MSTKVIRQSTASKPVDDQSLTTVLRQIELNNVSPIAAKNVKKVREGDVIETDIDISKGDLNRTALSELPDKFETSASALQEILNPSTSKPPYKRLSLKDMPPPPNIPPQPKEPPKEQRTDGRKRGFQGSPGDSEFDKLQRTGSSNGSTDDSKTSNEGEEEEGGEFITPMSKSKKKKEKKKAKAKAKAEEERRAAEERKKRISPPKKQ